MLTGFAKILTEEHKNKRMAASRENICRYQDEGISSMESVVTGYGTWVCEFTSESNQKKLHDLETSSSTHYKKIRN
jgi:hypothetical protein